MFLNQRHWLASAADKGGSGGSSDDPVAKAFENLLERKGGDTYATAMMLFEENKKYRDRIDELKGKLPEEGSVLLTEAEAKIWESYKALGPVNTLKQGLEKSSQLQIELDGLHREATLRKVADVAGFKFTVLAERDELAKARGKALDFEVRDVEVNNVKVPVAFVRAEGSEKTLQDYAEEHWSDVMSSLKLQPETGSTNGTPYLAQHVGTGGTKPLTTKAKAEEVLSKAYGPRPAA